MTMKEVIDQINIVMIKLEELHGGEFYPVIKYRTGMELIIYWIKDKNKAIEKPQVWTRGYIEDDTEFEKMVTDTLKESIEGDLWDKDAEKMKDEISEEEIKESQEAVDSTEQSELDGSDREEL